MVLATSDANQLRVHGVEEMEHEKVSGLSWSTLLDKHSLLIEGSALGVLLVDTEGLDCELLLDFPFGSLRP